MKRLASATSALAMLMAALVVTAACMLMQQRTLVPMPPPTGGPTTGENWALIIGIDTYHHGLPLQTAVRDALEVREELAQRYGVRHERILELLNGEATRRNIEDTLFRLSHEAHPEDTILIYFAGHAQYDRDGRLEWLVPADGLPQQPDTLITSASFRESTKEMKAKQVALFHLNGGAVTVLNVSEPTLQAEREAQGREKQQADEELKRQAEEQAKRETEERARLDAERLAREKEEQVVKLAQQQQLEEEQKQLAAEQARRDAEEQARREAEQVAREQEERAQQQVEQKRFEEKRKLLAEEKARQAAEEQARLEAERLAREQEELAKQQAEQQRLEEERRRIAEEQAKRAAEERARLDAERLAREKEEQAVKLAQQQQREEEQKQLAEDQAQRKAEDAARREAERLTQEQAALAQQLAEQRRLEEERMRLAERKARQEAEERAQQATEQLAREREERAKLEAQLKRLEEERQRLVEEKSRQESEQVAREREQRDKQQAEQRQAAPREEAQRKPEERRRSDEQAKARAEQRSKPIEEARVRPFTPPPSGRELIGKDGAPMVLVPAGEFTMGGESIDNPRHPVYLDAFYADKYEATASRYAGFLKATGRQPPYKWNEVRLVSHGDRPVIGVTWEDADAYCRWAGKRLLTEAEWEKAARGTDGREYPWGNEAPTPRHANFNKCCDWKGYGMLAIVGSLEAGRSPYGIYDLAGNVAEWVADWYDKTSYKYELDRNPKGPPDGEEKVVRGGSWFDAGQLQRSAMRSRSYPKAPSTDRGFRCAKDAK